MVNAIIDSERKKFFTVFDADLLDNVRVTKMEKFLREKGWMQWTPYFWAKYEVIITHLQNKPNYPGMLLEDAYEYELKQTK